MQTSRVPNPRYTRHVDALYGDGLVQLFEAAETVEKMLEHPGVRIVAAILDRERGVSDDALDGSEKPLEQAEYAFAHGRRGGLRAFLQAADALVARAAKRRQEQAEKHESGAESPLGR
jgi:hypothetical protein